MSSLAQTAYEEIRQRIVSGEFTSDTSLSETWLALVLQVSRTPVREAIRRLENEGLLEQRPKQGTYVHAPNRRELRELFEVRIFLEPFAAGRAARKSKPELIRKLADLIEQMNQLFERLAREGSPQEKMSLYREHMTCDRAFHEAIIQESGNRRICKIVNEAGILSTGLGFPKDRPPVWQERMKHAQREHARILLAVIQKDPRSAVRAMRHHLVIGRRNAMDYFDWLEQQKAARELGAM